MHQFADQERSQVLKLCGSLLPQPSTEFSDYRSARPNKTALNGRVYALLGFGSPNDAPCARPARASVCATSLHRPVAQCFAAERALPGIGCPTRLGHAPVLSA